MTTKKHYQWLLFDVDGTLFDFHRAEGLALQQAFKAVNTPFKDEYLDVYRKINMQLWQMLERREVTSAVLRIRRFELLLEAIQLECAVNEMSTSYIEALAACGDLIDGAIELLNQLHGNYKLAIVTNGMQAVQRGRLAHSPLNNYFDAVIISEEVGAAKPETAYFTATFDRIGHPAKSDVMIIGDSLASDMRGGVDFGIDTCWFNPARDPRPADLPITYEIAHLSELLAVLG
jgi:2-haloacid dehalogenase